MSKKKNNIYTTIQIRKEINEHVKKFCKEHGIVASTHTENYWIDFISSSMSGSVFAMGG